MNPLKTNKIDINVSKHLRHITLAACQSMDEATPFRCKATSNVKSINSHFTSVPLQQLTEEEQKVFRLYGKLPDRKDLLDRKLKVS